jgi:hypothetical protein
VILILIYLSTAVVLTPGGSTHLHINNTHNNTINNKTPGITNKTDQITNLEECWPCPVFANYTLAFALQLKKKHGKTSVRVVRGENTTRRPNAGISVKETHSNM